MRNWKNITPPVADACPQFIAFGELNRSRVVVTINWEDRCGCGQDYIATHYNADEEVDKDFGSDDFAEVLAIVEAWEKAALANWYAATIGYDPFLDDPAQTVAEIRKVKREYLAAIEAGE